VFSALFPIIATTDMSRALGFYRDLLGASVEYEFTGPDGTVAYVGLRIASAHLGIGLDPALVPAPRPRAMSLWLYTDDCDVAVEHLRRAGVAVVEEPSDRPWGERVARVLDPDGNEIVIGARLETDS
jgi:uncharacterized glyoxalase superfamily protein PhnB